MNPSIRIASIVFLVAVTLIMGLAEGLTACEKGPCATNCKAGAKAAIYTATNWTTWCSNHDFYPCLDVETYIKEGYCACSGCGDTTEAGSPSSRPEPVTARPYQARLTLPPSSQVEPTTRGVSSRVSPAAVALPAPLVLTHTSHHLSLSLATTPPTRAVRE